MTQRLVVRQLLSGLLRLRLYGAQHIVYVTLQNDAVIHNGSDFINHLWCCERGVGGYRHTQNQHSPVLHTFSIVVSAVRELPVKHRNIRKRAGKG